MDFVKPVVHQLKGYVKTLSTKSLVVGLLLGFFFTPLIGFLIFTIIVPFAILVAVLLVAAYFLLKKKGAQPRDFRLLQKAVPFKLDGLIAAKRNTLTDDYWYSTYKTAEKEKVCLIQAETGACFTYYDVEALSNRISQWALDETISAKDNVALFIGNRLEYFPMWLGMAKIGARTALINFNLRGKALSHCITAVDNPRGVIFDAEHAEAIDQVRGDLPESLQFWYYGDAADAPDWATSIKPTVEALPPTRVEVRYRARAAGVHARDPLVYVYTSGTTGLPKAAIISHHRLRMMTCAFPIFGSYTTKDVMYCCLPLYHSAGGLLALGSVLWSGATMVIRGKFSASSFSRECRKYNVTLFQYIGQICRYLVNAPPQPDDKRLKIRVATGNGMRAEVWPRFVKKYNVPKVLEFYGATEGPSAMINSENKPGSIGFLSPVLSAALPQAIVRFDRNEEKEVRGADGFCIKCKPDEPGHFLAKVTTSAGVNNYNGYTNKKASDKKLIHDVFKKGDTWFCSGDLLRADKEGFVYFVDRIGDTFRWKGENCSTNEVATVLASLTAVPDVNVYGVEVNNNDGRAGMACVIGADADSFPFDKLAKLVRDELPAYARPLFVRFKPQAEITSTFKHKKIALQKEGFDPSAVTDPLYFFDGKTYNKIDADLYERIQNGTVRV